MKPIFNKINGNLYMELEKPVPLTEDSFIKFNKHDLGCVVRLIQDDTQMGRFNKLHLIKECLEPIKCMTGIDKFCQATLDSFARTYVGHSIYCYEIIGYLVKPNSTEWGLYQMMEGKKIANERWAGNRIHCTTYCYLDGNMCRFDGLSKGVAIHISEFLVGVIKDGWEIYEPKPEPKPSPKDVKVKITLEGTVSQDSILKKAECFTLHTEHGEYIISLNSIEESEQVSELLKAQEENNG